MVIRKAIALGSLKSASLSGANLDSCEIEDKKKNCSKHQVTQFYCKVISESF